MKRRLNIKDLAPRKDSPYQQGYYKLINPVKYYGDPTKIIFRSSWEKRFALYCDVNDRVLAWSSEPFEIQYLHPIDNVMKPYNIDFYVKLDRGEGSYAEYIVEVKPEKQLKKPNKPVGRMTEKKLLGYNAALKTFLINTSKFAAAKSYAEGRGWQFIIATEKFIM